MKRTLTPRDALYETAARLFYQRGYRATGVDAIAAESGIGKMTLYRHFPSKDDLIVAYLRESDRVFWATFDRVTSGVLGGRGKLLAFFAALGDYTQDSACFGCPFLNVAGEYPDSDYPGHRIAVEHKQAVRARFRELAEEAGARQPELLADALSLLMDGAYMAARVFGGLPGNPAAGVAGAARRMIDAACDE